MKPNYLAIFSDIIEQKYPEKRSECEMYLKKSELSSQEILMLNQMIFGKLSTEDQKFNQRHKSYSIEDIQEILAYQKIYKLNNTQLANHFKISRNTITKWKKM